MFRRTSKHRTEESKRALADAQKNLKRIRARRPEVCEVSESLRGWRERNHFIEQLDELMSQPKGHTP